MTDLNTAILAAHVEDDKQALVTLYTRAANQTDTIDEECFFLTHAYIYALELDHTQQQHLADRLQAYGRL